jgi:hypothetical protein
MVFAFQYKAGFPVVARSLNSTPLKEHFIMKKQRILLARTFSYLLVVSLVLLSYTLAQPNFSEWSAPENLGPVVNSTFRDANPAISKDGLSLYFNSNRPGGFPPPGTAGANDIYVSQRTSVEGPWGPPVNLGAVINTSTIEAGPALSRDEHWLFFQSDRSGGFGGLDIWASYREHTHDDFGWQSPVNVGAAINSASEDTDPDYFENDDAGVPQVFFSSNRPNGIGGFDFYVSDLSADGTFSPARLIPELSSTVADPALGLRFDGLEVFFMSARSGGLGGQDLWTANRDTVFDPWSSPANLGPLVNSTSADTSPYIASDRQTMYFSSNRGGGSGDFDLYVTTRTREKR